MIAIYARVSTEEQVKKGYSLQDQVRACRKLAGTEDVVEYIDEGISGEILDRPQLTLLRKAVTEGCISQVICLDPDRLSRKLINQLIVSEEIEKRAQLVFVNGEYNQTAEGKLFYQLRGAISEFEKAKITERMSRGRREKAHQGKIIRDYSIYGYSFDPIKHQLIVSPFEAEVVRNIFSLFTGKYGCFHSMNRIAIDLTAQGVPTKRGAKSWHRQVIRQILMNRAYIGEFYQNRWNCEGTLMNKFKPPEDRISPKSRPEEEWILVPCPPIIEPDEFLFTQQLLEESRRRWAGKSKTSYLLSGLVRCGNCGNTMPGRKSMNWGKEVYEYCDIKGVAGAKNRGCGQRIKSCSLESIVWEKILQILKENISSIDINQLALEPSTRFNSNLHTVDEKLSILSRTRENLINSLSLFEQDLGPSGLEQVRAKLNKLRANEEKLLLQKKMLLSDKEHNIAKQPEVSHAVFNQLLENAGFLTYEDKYGLIHCIIKEIQVFGNQIKIVGF